MDLATIKIGIPTTAIVASGVTTAGVLANSSDSINSDSKPFDYSLQLSNETLNIRQALNAPGDCVKRMFPGSEQTSFFKKPKILRRQIENLREIEVFKGVNVNDNTVDQACLLYNEETNQQFRTELAIKKDEEGWVWMSGVVNKNSKPELVFRELILNKFGSTWNVVAGNEGVVIDVPFDNYETSKPSFKIEVLPQQNKDLITNQDCLSSCSISYKAAYWKPKSTSSYELVQFANNSGHIVSVFNSTEKTKISKSGTRQNIYLNRTWYSDETTPGISRVLVSMNENNVVKAKGEWTEIDKLCATKDEDKQTTEDYLMFCK